MNAAISIRPPTSFNAEHILDAIEFLFEPGDVIEIRALEVDRSPSRTGATFAGYFDFENTDAICEAVRSVYNRAVGIYVVLNKLNPALLARSNNHLTRALKNTTADADIIERRWLGIDLDPVKPAGISSTDAEHQAGLDRAVQIREFLTEQGWPVPLYADSGNSAHLTYRLPHLELNDETTELLKACLAALAEKFDDAAVIVDKTTFNAARIWKLYGTLARKGEAMPDRPHRLSHTLDGPEDRAQPVPLHLLEQLAAAAPARHHQAPAMPRRSPGTSQFDMDAWLAARGLAVVKGPESYDGGSKWTLDRCPFNPAHEKPVVIELASGALVFRCLHSSCKENGWPALRRLFDPSYRVRETLANTDSETHTPTRQICVNNRQLREYSDEALSALQAANNPPSLFVRSGMMVAIARDEKQRQIISRVSEAGLRGSLTRSADYYKINSKGNHVQSPPPIEAVRDILSQAPTLWKFQPLDGIVEAPILRPDGSILDTPGYDAATQLFYAPDPTLRVPAIAEHPTKDDVAAAVRLIDQAICEFPFVDQAGKANAYGAMLTPVTKPATNAPTPMGLFDAPQAGTGKSLLADVVSIIATGRPGEMFSAPRDEDEWRKQITMALMTGTSVVVIDNVNRRLDNSDLCKVLTETLHVDRAFHTHDKILLPVKSTWIATGNNIQVGGDMPRRCYWVRMDAKTSRPFLRADFKIEDLKKWTLENRGQLLAALLTLARAWYAAGQPAPKLKPLGSYEAWSITVGGILEHAGVEGFLDNAGALYDEADVDSTQWENFLHALDDVFYGEPFTVAQIMEAIKEKVWNANAAGGKGAMEPTPRATKLRAALPDSLAEAADRDGFFQRRTGKCFAERIDRRFGSSQIHLKRDPLLHGYQNWRVVRNAV